MKRIKGWIERLYWEAGQTTAEYALVMLAAAAVVTVLIIWASQKDSKLNEFFDKIVGELISRVGGGGDGAGGATTAA